MTTVLKLGGSVVTEKDTRETVDDDALTTAAGIVGEWMGGDGSGSPPLVLVHGGGSFGHPAAATHGVSATEGSRDAAALVAVHRAMGRLNERVVTALQAAGVAALPVRPLSLVDRTDEAVNCPAEPVESMLDEGFSPVLHGDVVVHREKGGTVLSGDGLVVALADALDADRIGVCSTVPGVLDDDGEVVTEIPSYGAVADLVGESESTDVTGGMAGKIRALLDTEQPAAIFGLDGLATFLETGQAGTTVR
jgi:isopentenyl phosphate kinase